MGKSNRTRISPTVEYGFYILLLIGCIIYLVHHFYGRPNVEPVIIFQAEETPLPDIQLPVGD